jgi:four helix bundle protein
MTRTSFTQPISAPAPDALSAAVLDAERLDVYRLAVAFDALAQPLAKAAGRNLRDQLDRASTSISLNIAEGAARRSPRDKAHFFAIARGSAAECAAIVQLLASRGRIADKEAAQARSQVVRIVSMLVRLEQHCLRQA